MASCEPEGAAKDFLSRPVSALVWWGLPLVVGGLAGVLPVMASAKTAAWAGAFAWMGLGCTLNARRCGRRHCYISAPVLFLGAAAAAGVAFGIAPGGQRAAPWVIDVTLGLALLTFLVEPVWGKYRPR